jgi:probable Rubsico expression protein CbbX
MSIIELAPADCAPATVHGTLADTLASSGIREMLAQLDRELIGLAPVKSRIRDIAALLLVDKLRAERGFSASAPSLHMSFTGNPGTGKTTVAMRMAQILLRLGYVRRGHLVAVTRDDLVGQYIGHTAPKTREILKKAMGGVLFIDEAYYLYRPENERDYGQEAIEILLQVMENNRDDLVVILAGYKDRMDRFPDYGVDELASISGLMLKDMQYRFDHEAEDVFRRYIERRMALPHFANARSVRNALDRARLRHASRLLATPDAVDDDALVTITAADLLGSRVFGDAAPAPAPATS